MPHGKILEERMPITILHKLPENWRGEYTFQNSLYAACITLVPKENITVKENHISISLINIHAKILNKI